MLICAPLVPALAAGVDPHAPVAPASPKDRQAVEQQIIVLKQQLRLVVQHNAEQTAALRALIDKLERLDAEVNPREATPRPQAAAPAEAPPRRKRPAQTETSKAVYQQQNALFTRRLTLEPKITYTYYDRNQINLNGFLALSAIFLGNISVQKVKASTLQFDLLAREGVTNRLQFAADLPFLYRSFEFLSGGAGGSASTLSQANVHTHTFEQGDINGGFYYQVARETATHPNVVWNVQAIAPTGVEPYGIKLVQPNPSNSSLVVPASLPTGNGVWGTQTGLSFVKTSDPAILFASVGYLHYFAHHFKDISSTAGQVVPGSVQLGDVYQYGLGMAFALNRRMSLSTSYAQSIAGRAETKADGAGWQYIAGSDANAASFNIGVTYGLSMRETLVTNLGIGLTKDAPDLSLSISMPYSF